MTEQEWIGGDPLPTWRATLPNRPLTGLTVLVVEDSRVASEAVRLLCLRSGARIRRADSIRTALRHLQTYRPGAVLVDMGLPDGNGADMIATIAKAQPRVPVILGISGDPDNREAAMRAGADGFLPKPIESLATFQQAILSVLPVEARPQGLRILPDEVISADPGALRDDLAHVAEVLSLADNTAAIDYIARFLAGVARSAHDRMLEDAAATLARDHSEGRALASDLARISGLVQDRLATVRIN
ncbi:response regulator [Paracoccus lutimaris]|uniref:Response regulator receiver domain-containing protein n=1 Tax=Paracoccus lutimaris TaxID=1490030 RepID=A0A368YZY7_9RHOB|nr:response regulator [Paracoccus lutimaris]RCW84796.1 response regulator receiver domain-containing protein [Paracoccus lutimaris]